MNIAPVHLAVPFRIEGGRVLTVEQDTLDELIQNVSVIVGTRRGERLSVPDFGISDPTFQDGIDTAEIAAAIAEGEDRAEVRLELRDPQVDGEHGLAIAVSYRGEN